MTKCYYCDLDAIFDWKVIDEFSDNHKEIFVLSVCETHNEFLMKRSQISA